MILCGQITNNCRTLYKMTTCLDLGTIISTWTYSMRDNAIPVLPTKNITLFITIWKRLFKGNTTLTIVPWLVLVVTRHFKSLPEISATLYFSLVDTAKKTSRMLNFKIKALWLAYITKLLNVPSRHRSSDPRL